MWKLRGVFGTCLDLWYAILVILLNLLIKFLILVVLRWECQNIDLPSLLIIFFWSIFYDDLKVNDNFEINIKIFQNWYFFSKFSSNKNYSKIL